MTTCPRCGHHFVPAKDVRSEDSFSLFHVYRDAFAKYMNWSNVYTKNWLCVHYGVSLEYEPGKFVPPKWPGVFCEVDDWIHFRKSTLFYTKAEMTDLIARTAAQMAEAGIEVPVA